MFNVQVLSLFPEMFPGPLGHSLIGKALENKLWNLNVANIRDYAEDNHKTVDDTPYGGGAGMVMRPDIVGKAIDEALAKDAESKKKVIYMSPRGVLLNQQKTKDLIDYKDIVILCGRYEGLDQRVIDKYDIEEVSIGDYVLSGGEIAAMALIEACVRQISGVLGNPDTLLEESFSAISCGCLLEYPLYTKPANWLGEEVPGVLRSGNHGDISSWRKAKSEEITKQRRPDLWQRYEKK